MWLQITGMGPAKCLPCRFPGMIKPNCYYHYCVVANYRNRFYHMSSIQDYRHDANIAGDDVSNDDDNENEI
jgi:hypothetical protein